LCGGFIAWGAPPPLAPPDERPGVKFADAELTGIPVRVAVGSRDLADGLVEVVTRVTGKRDRVPLDQAVPHVLELLAAAG
jgi:prolyl-tRNA synthetase